METLPEQEVRRCITDLIHTFTGDPCILSSIYVYAPLTMKKIHSIVNSVHISGNKNQF